MEGRGPKSDLDQLIDELLNEEFEMLAGACERRALR